MNQREQVKCDICGAELPRWKMEPITIGRKTELLCPDCYNSGAHKANGRVMMHVTQIRRERLKRDR